MQIRVTITIIAPRPLNVLEDNSRQMVYISKYVYDPKSYNEVVVLITFGSATTLRITRETRKTSFENRRSWSDGRTDDLTKEI